MPVWMGKNTIQPDIQMRIDNGEYTTNTSQPEHQHDHEAFINTLPFSYLNDSEEELVEDTTDARIGLVNNDVNSDDNMNEDSTDPDAHLDDKDIGSDESMPSQ